MRKTTKAIIYPLEVRVCKVVDNDHEVNSFAGQLADFSMLPTMGSLKDCLPPRLTPNISEDLVSKPFEATSYPLEDGIHLHWSLPKALRSAHIYDPESVGEKIEKPKIEYRDAPNRWLVKRRVYEFLKEDVELGFENEKVILAENPTEILEFGKTFYIESDLLSIGDPNGSNAFPYKPDSYQPGDPLYRYIGKCWDYAKWKTRYADKVVTKGEELYQENLNAFGYGEPLYAAYYPECKNVFGFHDNLEVPFADDVLKKELAKSNADGEDKKLSILKTDRDFQVSYHVVGWYDNPYYDPTYLATVASEKMGDEFHHERVLGELQTPAEELTQTLSYTHKICQTQNGFDLNWNIDEEKTAELFTEVKMTQNKKGDTRKLEWELDGRLLFSRKLEVDWPIESETWMYEAMDKEKKILWQSDDEDSANETLLKDVKTKILAEIELVSLKESESSAAANAIDSALKLATAKANLSIATKGITDTTLNIPKSMQRSVDKDDLRNKAIEIVELEKEKMAAIIVEENRIRDELNQADDKIKELEDAKPAEVTKLKKLRKGIDDELVTVLLNKTTAFLAVEKAKEKLAMAEDAIREEADTLEQLDEDLINYNKAKKIEEANVVRYEKKDTWLQKKWIQAKEELATAEATNYTMDKMLHRLSLNSISSDRLIINHIANLLNRYPDLNINIFYGGKSMSEKLKAEIKDQQQLKIMEEILDQSAAYDIKRILGNLEKQGIKSNRYTFSNATVRSEGWQKGILTSSTFLALDVITNGTPDDFDIIASLKTLSNTKIAIGNTPPQAYAALIANLSTKEATIDEKNKKIQSKELLLDALQLGLLTQLDEPDLIPRIDNGIHQSSFIPEDGGHIWRIEMKTAENAMENRIPTEGGKADDETLLLWSKELKKLNDEQAKFDELRYTIASEQKVLYADWYKFMTAEYNLKLGVITQKTQVNEIRNYLTEQMKKLYDNFMLLEKITENVTTYQDNLKAELDKWMKFDTEKQRKVYSLENVVHDRFWSPAEPAILLHGKDIEHSTRYHDSKPDVVKIIEMELSADNEELIATLETSMSRAPGDIKPLKKTTKKKLQEKPWSAIQDGTIDWYSISFESGLLFNTLEAATWDPIYLDWQVKLYPVTKPFGHENEQYPWQEDAVLKNFDLESGELDLLLNITDADNIKDADNSRHLIDYFVKQDSTQVLQTVDGRSVLTPNAQQSMIQAIKDAWAHAMPEELKQETVGKDALINSINNVKILSQNLSGLNDAFLMQKQILQLSVFDPLADNQVLDDFTNGMLSKLIGNANSTSPLPHNLFLPIREGYMRISKLRMVDTFGRINSWDADDHFEDALNLETLNTAPEIILSESLKTKKEDYIKNVITTVPEEINSETRKLAKENLHAQFLKKSAFLPPRLSQPSRLNVNLHDATENLAKSQEHFPSEHDLNFNPVCGWLLPNFLDQTLYVYDANGKPIKVIGVFKRKKTPEEITERIPIGGKTTTPVILEVDEATQEEFVFELMEMPVPGNNKIQEVENEYLQMAIDFLLKSQPNTTEPVVNFREFISTTFSALQNVEPKQFAQFTGTALMMGKPLAIIRASINLEIKGAPAIDYNWQKRMQTYLGNEEEKDEQRQEVVSQMGFTRVKFPLRLGAVSQANDGLVGYFVLPENKKINANSAAVDNSKLVLNEFYSAVSNRELNHTIEEYSRAELKILQLKNEQVFMDDARLLMPFVKELYRWAIDEEKPEKSAFLADAISMINDTEILGEGELLIAKVARLTDATFQFINTHFKNWMGTLDIAQLLDNCLKSGYEPLEGDDLDAITATLNDLGATALIIGSEPNLSGLTKEEKNQYQSSIALIPFVNSILEYGQSGGALDKEERMDLDYNELLAEEGVDEAITDPLELTDEEHLSVRGRLRLLAIFEVFGIRLDIDLIKSLTDIYIDNESEIALTNEVKNKIKTNIIKIENNAYLYAAIQFQVNEEEIDKLTVILQNLDEEKDVKAPNIYNEPKPDFFSLTADGKKQEVLLLTDPRANVHVTTGILPVKTIEIPASAIADAIENIQMTFLTAPILTPPVIEKEKDFLTIPTLKEKDARWSWWEKKDKETWENLNDKNIQRPPERQINIPHNLTLREGWLQLRKGPAETENDANDDEITTNADAE